LLQIQQAGLFAHWKTVATREYGEKVFKENGKPKDFYYSEQIKGKSTNLAGVKIKVADYFGLFTVYGCLIVMATTAFGAEHFIFKKSYS